MKFTHYKTRTNEILLEEKMAKLTERSYEETKERYKNARFIVFTPILLDEPIETSQENKDGLTHSHQQGPVELRKHPR